MTATSGVAHRAATSALERPRVGLIGCGDVLFRSYLPGLQTVAERLEVVACCDRDPQRARRAQAACRPLWSSVEPYDDVGRLLSHDGLEAIIDLTPAPQHFAVNHAAIEAGLHVYSEKPLAGSHQKATTLIAMARDAGVLLLAAPAVMATPRFRWIKELIAAGRIGRPTLATAQLANMGPASWRAYTGDPEVYYGAQVGPLLDQGVYLLHAITGLLGSVSRVQAFGGVAIPERKILAGPRAGETITVTGRDQMLVQLDFGDGRFGQVLSSFAVPGSRVPTLEIHGTLGSLVVGAADSQASAPVDLFQTDDSPLGLESWLSGLRPPDPPPLIDDLIAFGPTHFVECLRREQTSVLTPEHAAHVLEIASAAHASIDRGAAVSLESRFGPWT